MTQAHLPLVLIVDDYPDARDMYAELFTGSGFRVARAADGREALATAFAVQPDVIVMDLSLPDMDGWEATRQLKKDPRTRSIPVVVLTGHTLARYREGARSAGCDAFLTKPCLPDDLLAEVRKQLGMTKPAAPRRGRPSR